MRAERMPLTRMPAGVPPSRATRAWRSRQPAERLPPAAGAERGRRAVRWVRSQRRVGQMGVACRTTGRLSSRKRPGGYLIPEQRLAPAAADAGAVAVREMAATPAWAAPRRSRVSASAVPHWARLVTARRLAVIAPGAVPPASRFAAELASGSAAKWASIAVPRTSVNPDLQAVRPQSPLSRASAIPTKRVAAVSASTGPYRPRASWCRQPTEPLRRNPRRSRPRRRSSSRRRTPSIAPGRPPAAPSRGPPERPTGTRGKKCS
jgi:hypothetical protein